VVELLDFVMRLYPPARPSARDILQHNFFQGVSDEPFDVKGLFERTIYGLND
jgi:hypothetical protein